eukprot:3058581-Amphidinium_carterae.1
MSHPMCQKTVLGHISAKSASFVKQTHSTRVKRLTLTIVSWQVGNLTKGCNGGFTTGQGAEGKQH